MAIPPEETISIISFNAEEPLSSAKFYIRNLNL